VAARTTIQERIAELKRRRNAVISTGGMLRHARQSAAPGFIVATELGLLHGLKGRNPEKHLVAATRAAVCPNMKLITLEKVLWALEEMKYVVRVPEHVREPARRALDAMFRLTESRPSCPAVAGGAT